MLRRITSEPRAWQCQLAGARADQQGSQRPPVGNRCPAGAHGFTLIEVLVVMGIIALLLAILLPSLGAARAQARLVVCGSNIRQLAVANTLYSDENEGRYCPGAADFLQNLHRWHGTRGSRGEPFDSSRGPLVPYLGPDAQIRACPSFSDFDAGPGAFERGCGGYGYNNYFIGMELEEVVPGFYAVKTDRSGASSHRVCHPGRTIMFTDAAFAPGDLIEYSFAEPRFHPVTGGRADPSIHFRHRGRTNVLWVDCHVDAHRRTFVWSSGLYLGNPDRAQLGWFGKNDDNRLFDLR